MYTKKVVGKRMIGIMWFWGLASTLITAIWYIGAVMYAYHRQEPNWKALERTCIPLFELMVSLVMAIVFSIAFSIKKVIKKIRVLQRLTRRRVIKRLLPAFQTP